MNHDILLLIIAVFLKLFNPYMQSLIKEQISKSGVVQAVQIVNNKNWKQAALIGLLSAGVPVLITALNH